MSKPIPWKRNPSPNKRGWNGLSLSMLSWRPIQLPPAGRNDCGPGGRRGTIPYHTMPYHTAAYPAGGEGGVAGVLGRGRRARSGTSSDPNPAPDGGYARPGACTLR
jgi:hypothetical protein